MNILIPTDLSEESLLKLPGIIKLFQRDKVTFTLFHAVEPLQADAALVLMIDDILYEEAKVKLNQFISQLSGIEGINKKLIYSEVKVGAFETCLNLFLKQIRPELVILMSKSRQGIDKILQRKKSLKFIGEIKQPLLIVPYQVDIDKINIMGVSVEEKEPLEQKTIHKIEYLANHLGTELKFFHVNTNTYNDLSFYSERINTSNKSTGYISIISNPVVSKGIEMWMFQNNVEILTMITHSKHFFTSLFSNSMTRVMVKRNSSVLLIITQ